MHCVTLSTRELAMRLFMLRTFERFASKERITNDVLKSVVALLRNGDVSADLGGFVYKQRVPRPGGGKSGGYRVLLFYREDDRVFFAHGFAKSDKANTNQRELATLKQHARLYMSLTDAQLDILLQQRQLFEIM
jgi:hypothetical protein